ncbi:MAG: efflux RND transporter permease subunit [Proteobacteria bacterium]|nr:efflux RND transporter permease subunit [Pseudomonadota bacterium]
MSPIGIFTRHPTAANLLMVLMVIAGVFALTRLNTQFFPDFGIDWVQVSVEWPGASAEDVDENIVQAIEPEVRFLDGVKLVRSSSVEGRAIVAIEFKSGADMQAALADVETAVDQVTTLPEDSERPVIKRVVRYDRITRILISGPYSETALKTHAKRIREDLLAHGIDKIDLVGTRDEEIWVEVEPATLRRLDLTIDDIAERIAGASQDVPSGNTRGAAERQIRSLGMRKTAQALGDVEVRALANGEKIYLRDIARVSEQFEEQGVTLRRDGKRAIELFVQRSLTADALEVADIVDTRLAELRPELPADLVVEQYDVAAELIRGRVDLLLRNGLGGLVLVVTILFIFLNARVAFWIAVGIPVALMATMAVMLWTGQSINMISLFGLIMALGIVVDDAIVVGEHAATRFRAGLNASEAAEAGARRMMAPVVCSSLTTIAAFVPLLIISDVIGDIIKAIPYVMIAVIVASLVECFLVLPGHLRHALSRSSAEATAARRWFRRNFDHFRDHRFRRAVDLCVRWRYTTLASAVAALILSVGMVAGDRVGFNFFPSPEGDWVYANVKLFAGTPRSQTVAMLDEMERAMRDAEARLTGDSGGLVKLSVARVGASAGRRAAAAAVGDNVGGIVVELFPADQRDITGTGFIDAWREEVMLLPGVETLTIVRAQGGPPGREIDVRLSGADAVSLKAAANEVRALLARYPGVSDIETDLPYGKQETVLEVNARGRALGFDTASVGRQVRTAFEGVIAKRFPRGDEEVLVRVLYPRELVDAAALDSLYVRAPSDAEVALSDVVDRRETRGFAIIKREDGARQVAVTAEIDKAVTTNNKVLAGLTGSDGDGPSALEDIAARHGVTFGFAGKKKEQDQTFSDMKDGALIGLAAIYIILAWVFASYTRPLVVMSVIPLGFVGATLGHWLLGYDLTILSLVALIGLSGIIVNDSIILVTTIDERLREGQAVHEAIVDGACDRLRAVILTSATTIGGLTPLLFETSLQAQFLIPMALTIVFGLMVATLLVLLVVPSLIAVQDDVRRLVRYRRPAAAVEGRAAE